MVRPHVEDGLLASLYEQGSKAKLNKVVWGNIKDLIAIILDHFGATANLESCSPGPSEAY